MFSFKFKKSIKERYLFKLLNFKWQHGVYKYSTNSKLPINVLLIINARRTGRIIERRFLLFSYSILYDFRGDERARAPVSPRYWCGRFLPFAVGLVAYTRRLATARRPVFHPVGKLRLPSPTVWYHVTVSSNFIRDGLIRFSIPPLFFRPVTKPHRHFFFFTTLPISSSNFRLAQYPMFYCLTCHQFVSNSQTRGFPMKGQRINNQ